MYLNEEDAKIAQLSPETGSQLSQLISNANNPHILGTNAQEVFFLDDRIVLLEGQEDVIYYDVVARDLGLEIRGDIYGWGVGGADNMKFVAQILKELGFSQVVGILDGNMEHRLAALHDKFPGFRFVTIPADDVRTKPASKAKSAVDGLLDDKNQQVRPEYVDKTRKIIATINDYLAS